MRLFLDMPGAPAVAGVAPTNGVRPFITGSPVVGNVLTINGGSWNGTPAPAVTSALVQQSSDGGTTWTTVPYDGSGSYTVRPADLGDILSVFVTAVNASGSATRRSLSTATVTNPGGPPVAPTVPPTPTTL